MAEEGKKSLRCGLEGYLKSGKDGLRKNRILGISGVWISACEVKSFGQAGAVDVVRV